MAFGRRQGQLSERSFKQLGLCYVKKINIIIIITNSTTNVVSTLWHWYHNKTQHKKMEIAHQVTHHAETKHSTQRKANIIIIIELNCEWVFTRLQWYYIEKHNTQSYTDIKGHFTHNE
jgi:hypothetical protein